MNRLKKIVASATWRGYAGNGTHRLFDSFNFLTIRYFLFATHDPFRKPVPTLRGSRDPLTAASTIAIYAL